MPQPADQEFQEWMKSRFSNVGLMGYTIVGPQSFGYNCFAHAIDADSVRLTPPNKHDVDTVYSDRGYYEVLVQDNTIKNGDAEVYSRDSAPGVPLHAHRVVDVTKPNVVCSSKMGDDFLIRHPRDLLQCRRKQPSRIHEYGTVRYRYRRDQKRFDIQQAAFTETSSGRSVKRSQTVLTKSLRRVLATRATRSKSNRIITNRNRK